MRKVLLSRANENENVLFARLAFGGHDFVPFFFFFLFFMYVSCFPSLFPVHPILNPLAHPLPPPPRLFTSPLYRPAAALLSATSDFVLTHAHPLHCPRSILCPSLLPSKPHTFFRPPKSDLNTPPLTCLRCAETAPLPHSIVTSSRLKTCLAYSCINPYTEGTSKSAIRSCNKASHSNIYTARQGRCLSSRSSRLLSPTALKLRTLLQSALESNPQTAFWPGPDGKLLHWTV